MRNIAKKTRLNGKTVHVKDASYNLDKTQLGKSGLFVEILDINTVEWLVNFSQESINKKLYDRNTATPTIGSIIYFGDDDYDDKIEMVITINPIVQKDKIYQLNYYEYEELKMVILVDSVKDVTGMFKLVYPTPSPIFAKKLLAEMQNEARAVAAIVKAAEVYLAVTHFEKNPKSNRCLIAPIPHFGFGKN